MPSSAQQVPPAPAVLEPLPARSDTLTSLVFIAIRDRIVDASLPPGSRVGEAMLAAQLQVSKTPVREALLRLRHIGLVEPGRTGLRVVAPSAATIRAAFELRSVLESASGRYAASRRTDREASRIRRLADESLDAALAGSVAEFLELDRAFHLAIAGAAGNPALCRAVGDSVVLTLALRQRDVRVDRDLVPDGREHVEIATHVVRGAANAAAGKLEDHLCRIGQLVLAAFPGRPETGP
ncbi:GntR family transcriptional regulator [Pseudonocardia sp. GCM10023141]|uniref:GntR family transcriptional regulator n=1 Tax=Pseudonocardia sp. GCM10023141 TaxID=3252653 RepID=UPI0036229C4E